MATCKWDEDAQAYKRARFWARAWSWQKAAEILSCTPAFLIETWGDEPEMRCPLSNRTYLETLEYARKLYADSGYKI